MWVIFHFHKNIGGVAAELLEGLHSPLDWHPCSIQFGLFFFIEYKESSLMAIVPNCAHGVGRVVGALGSEAGFVGSMLD